jgi:hypothetical protein
MPDPLVRRGALIFKGDNRPLRAMTVKKQPKQEKHAVNTTVCEGRIVSNGVTIQGFETRFKDEIEVGDIIIVRHPQSLEREERCVTAIISQRSLNVNRPFSCDFVSTTEFAVRKERPSMGTKTADSIKVEDIDEDGGVRMSGVNLAETLTKQKSVLSYQQKVGPWGYKTVTENLDRHYSEEELLDMRCKKVHDKYC